MIWVGPDLTPWLADPIAALAPGAAVLTLADAAGVKMLPARAGGPFEADEDEDEPARRDGRACRATGTSGSARRTRWRRAARSPRRWRRRIPAEAAAYAANAEAFAAETAALSQSIDAELAPLRGKPFLVFHDAYQYFERRFAIPAAGSVALHDGAAPGTARVAALRERVRDEGIVCAFTEPQFEPKLLATVIEGSEVRTGVLDPLGAALPPGPELYPALLRGIADGLVACLGNEATVARLVASCAGARPAPPPVPRPLLPAAPPAASVAADPAG